MSGEHLKKRREALGLTQNELAEILYGDYLKRIHGIQNISRWECGIHKVPHWVFDKIKELETKSKD